MTDTYPTKWEQSRNRSYIADDKSRLIVEACYNQVTGWWFLRAHGYDFTRDFTREFTTEDYAMQAWNEFAMRRVKENEAMAKAQRDRDGSITTMLPQR